MTKAQSAPRAENMRMSARSNSHIYLTAGCSWSDMLIFAAIVSIDVIRFDDVFRVDRAKPSLSDERRNDSAGDDDPSSGFKPRFPAAAPSMISTMATERPSLREMRLARKTMAPATRGIKSAFTQTSLALWL